MIAKLPSFLKLEHRRKLLGMSRAALARRSGVSLPTVQRILSGSGSAPSLPALHAVAAALGVQVSLGQDPAITELTTPAEFRRAQATEKSRQLRQQVQATMGLEGQAIAPEALDAISEQSTLELLAGPGRRLWDD